MQLKRCRAFLLSSHTDWVCETNSPPPKKNKCQKSAVWNCDFLMFPPYVDRNAYFCHNINFYTNKQRGSDIVVSWLPYLPTNEGREKKIPAIEMYFVTFAEISFYNV